MHFGRGLLVCVANRAGRKGWPGCPELPTKYKRYPKENTNVAITVCVAWILRGNAQMPL